MDFRHGVLVAAADQFGQYVPVHVAQRVDVEAGRAGLVLAQFGEQPIGVGPLGEPVKNQVCFPRRKADRRRVPFPATGVLVVIAAKTHNRRPVHVRFLPGNFLHQCQQLISIGTTGGMLYRRQEFLHGDVSGLGLVFCHVRSFPDAGRAHQNR